MADATGAIELIKRIIADDTADLRERVQHLESRTVGLTPIRSNGAIHPEESLREDGGDPPPQAEQLRELLHQHKDLEKRLDEIKAMHRLDATPVQYVRDNAGKMVEAPDGLWEISCIICEGMPTPWREGDSSPPHCKTWRIANGETVN